MRIRYDTPYVKGLPITMRVAENVDRVYKETIVRHTYEDAYTLKFKEQYAFITEGRPIKTRTEDAKHDLEVSRMNIPEGSKSEFMTGSMRRKGVNGINRTNGINGTETVVSINGKS